MLSAIERLLFLKEVAFFQGMTINHLRAVVPLCEEALFAADTHIFNQADPGGVLYIIVHGRVGIEQETRPNAFARLATVGAYACFGEMDLFDNRPRTVAALALQDTLTLRLRREPLIALARQYPDLALDLLHVLSQRLYEANERIVALTRTRPSMLQQLYDQLG